MLDPNGDEIKVKSRLIRLTFDLPARAGVSHQMGHGGRCACCFCYIQGIYAESNQSYCYVFVAFCDTFFFDGMIFNDLNSSCMSFRISRFG
jgi:hypothetical protein